MFKLVWSGYWKGEGKENSMSLAFDRHLHIASCKTWKDAIVYQSTVSYFLNVGKINYFTWKAKTTPIIFIKHCWAYLEKTFGRSGNKNSKTIQLKCIQVDGTVDNRLITDKFTEYFEFNCTPFTAVRDENYSPSRSLV